MSIKLLKFLLSMFSVDSVMKVVRDLAQYDPANDVTLMMFANGDAISSGTLRQYLDDLDAREEKEGIDPIHSYTLPVYAGGKVQLVVWCKGETVSVVAKPAGAWVGDLPGDDEAIPERVDDPRYKAESRRTTAVRHRDRLRNRDDSNEA